MLVCSAGFAVRQQASPLFRLESWDTMTSFKPILVNNRKTKQVMMTQVFPHHARYYFYYLLSIVYGHILGEPENPKDLAIVCALKSKTRDAQRQAKID